MNSYNHYAYGAIGEWLYTTVAGISSAAPGYKAVQIAPMPGGGLTYARSAQYSRYGKIRSAWEKIDDEFILSVEIPENTTANVVLPQAAGQSVMLDGKKITPGNGVNQVQTSGDNLLINLGSGSYLFSYTAEFSGSNRKKTPEVDANSTIGELIANRESRSILSQHASKLVESPWLSQVMGFTLKQADRALPESQKMGNVVIKRIKEDLKDF